MGDAMVVEEEKSEGTHNADSQSIHLYNRWLPQPIAEHVHEERARFHQLVTKLQETWQPGSPASALETVKFISVVHSFLKAQSNIALEDVEAVVRLGLAVIVDDSINLYVQARWTGCLTDIAGKYRRKLKLTVEWRPLYKVFLEAHFKRQQFYHGMGITWDHVTTFSTFIRAYRHFFPPESATEIWNEFRPSFDDLNHNQCLQAVGFVSLFLPTKGSSESYVFTRDWVEECLRLWAAIPSCQFWSLQWESLIMRCIKNLKLDWELYLPFLFMRYLNSFRVPVGRAGAHPPVNWASPNDVALAFHHSASPKIAASSIVGLLTPGGSTQAHFERLVDLLEPYYHPSNGGSWTDSLERFLHYLVLYFGKRLAKERKKQDKSRNLGPSERAAFIKAVLHLVERGQFSKSQALADTCARAVSLLSYIEPVLTLPIPIASFKTALNSVTATHQLKVALKTLALSVRPIFLSCRQQSGDQVLAGYMQDLADAMFGTLPGLDANDPPKTLATMQFYCSVLSNVPTAESENSFIPIDWTEWTFAFMDHLFTLLHSLEPGCIPSSEDSGDGFLLEANSHYCSLLGLFFGRLSEDLYKQVLFRIKKFVIGNVLTGAVMEVGNLCYCAVERNPCVAVSELLEPIVGNLISTLGEAPSTGFVNDEVQKLKATLSPALETTTTYQLKVLALAFAGEGATVLSSKDLLKEVINVAFNAPSVKVNDSARTFLKYLVGGLIAFNPTGTYRCPRPDLWIGTKEKDDSARPNWHLPSPDEISFVYELMEAHLQGSLLSLKRISASGKADKDYLRVTLLRLEGILDGLGSCLPDFVVSSDTTPMSVVGGFGATVGTPELRDQVAKVLHETCGYLLEGKGDESVILKLLISVMGLTVNFGSVENSWWSHSRDCWEAEAKNLTEPAVNFITDSDMTCKKRPLWLTYQRVYVQQLWRCSEISYYDYYVNPSLPLPPAVALLGQDLLKLSLHRYKEVRTCASGAFGVLLHRYPPLLHNFLPLITANLSDPGATEEAALGACALLRKRTIIRYLMEDWNCLASFLSSILNSSHHDSSKAQSAINKVFIAFNWYFGGVPLNLKTLVESGPSTFQSMISHVTSFIQNDSVHWRYNLMAQGLLLFLSLCPLHQVNKTNSLTQSEVANLELNRKLCGHFLSNLTSELPALRPLSVRAVLLLLGAEFDKLQKYGHPELNGASCLIQNLFNGNFGDKIIENLAVDHHYSEEESYSMPGNISDIGLISLIPKYMREWPVTRTWDLKTLGVAFSPTSAKLFEELTRRNAETVLNVLKQPLLDAAAAVHERGKQCTAAEIIAGMLRSGSASVAHAWEEWLSGLVRKSLKATSLDSAPEWTACIRYALSVEEGTNEQEDSVLRYKLFDCLAGLPSTSESSVLTAKRLNFLHAGLVEISTNKMLAQDIAFQANMLQEAISYMTHSAPQVRKAAGSVLCILLANLHSFPPDQEEDYVKAARAECTKQLIEGAAEAAQKVQASSNLRKEKQAVRTMETVFHFLLTCIRSGRFNVLMHIVVELLHPLLLLEETPEKDLANLAKSALRNLKWQHFSAERLSPVASIILRAANEENWRMRIAALKFVQPFIYRHSFVMDATVWKLLWDKATELLSDPQLEVRELASTTLAGMMKGAENSTIEAFRSQALATAIAVHTPGKARFRGFGSEEGMSVANVHAAALRLASCIFSVPYDIPSWLPEMVTTLAYFNQLPWPIRATVSKTLGEFRRTHSDAWDVQKERFTEEQLELLLNSGTASYYA